MKIVRLLAVCSIFITCSMAVIASAASATLWLHEGQSLTSRLLFTLHGLWLLHHTGGLTGAELIHCTGLIVGTIGPSALDTITEVQGLKGEINKIECEFTEGGSCGTTGAKETITAINLPWHTLLELVSGKTIDHILAEQGKEQGYEYGCSKIFGFKGSCKGLDLDEFVSNGTNGPIFKLPGTVKLSCTDGGEGTLLGEDEGLGAQVS